MKKLRLCKNAKVNTKKLKTAYDKGYRNGLKERCSRSAAFDLGETDGKNENPRKPSLKKLNICKHFNINYTSLIKAFEKGFRSGLKHRCSVKAAFDLGNADGKNEDLNKSSLGKLSICKDFNFNYSKLKKSFDEGYWKGFCSIEKVMNLAVLRAKSFQREDFSFLASCPASLKYERRKTYMETYKQELRRSCSPILIRERAAKDAMEGKNKQNELRKYSVCPNELQHNIIQAYTVSYDNAAKARVNAESAKTNVNKTEAEKKQ